MTTTQKYDYPKPGCYIDESASSADDCNRRTIEFAEAYGFDAGETNFALDADNAATAENEYSEWLSETGDDAVSFLNDLETRSFMSWQFEDNSLFLTVDVDSASEECEFKSRVDQDYPPDSYRGEWLHVSDHGNCTLYVRGDNGQDTEVWGVV